MIFKCEVEIDWIDEDSSIEESIQRKLASQVATQIAAKNTDLVTKAKEVLEKAITEKVADIFKNYMDEEVTVTDSMGKILKKNVTIKDLIREKFDVAMTMMVDKNGNPSKYSGSYTLRDWLIGKSVQKEVSKEFKGFSAMIKDTVKEEMQKKIKEEVADNFATLLVNLKKTGNKGLIE
jgi:hypothetical protein